MLRYKEAVSTVEFYNNPDGTIGLKIQADIPQSFDPELTEVLENLAMGVMQNFIHNRDELEYTGAVFKQGMEYASGPNGGDDDDDGDGPIVPPRSPEDDDLMAPIHLLEAFLKDVADKKDKSQ